MQDDNTHDEANTESSVMDFPEPFPGNTPAETPDITGETASDDKSEAPLSSFEDTNPQDMNFKEKKSRSKGAHKESHSAQFESFLKELNEQKDSEAKLEFAISFMEKSLASEHPDFKAFWEARSQCLNLFKENIPPLLRTQGWTKFSELSKEARRMKDVLDEQSDFAAEQIDIAISAIEKELDDMEITLEGEPSLLIPERADTLFEHYDFYNRNQRELSHLNLLASRITSLRKELIKTEMRIRTKNKFFDRLSKAGDRIFPRRKTLIQEISHQFTDDIEGFIQFNFGQKGSNKQIFDLREEIKALQYAAKLFTLNTQAFSQTRLKLSECWDTLKEKDKERKAEFEKRREEFKVNCDALKELIQATTSKFEAGELNLMQASESIEDIISEMRAKELGRDDVRELRSLIDEFRDKISDKQKVLDQDRLKQEEARNLARRELFNEFQVKIQNFIESTTNLSSDEILKERDNLNSEIQKSTLGKQDKLELEKSFKALKDILRQKREAALLALPSDDQEALRQLQELLKEKQEQRQEIKEQVEHYRKLLGGSGLGFEKGLEYNALLAVEREKWEKAQASVREVELKIEQLESKLS